MGVLLLLLTSLPFLHAQSNPARDQRWRDDLQFLQQQITRLHPNPYTQISRERFNESVQQLNDAIPQLSDAAVAMGLARIVASIQDLHSSLSLTQTSAGLRFLPIRLRWFPDGLYVTQAADAYGALIGRRVLRIGEKTAEEAYAAVRPYISAENDPWARLLSGNYLISPDILLTAGVLASEGPVPLQVEDETGARSVASVALASLSVLAGPVLAKPGFPHYRRYATQNYWYDYLADSGTLYIKYNACANMNALPFLRFLQTMVIDFATVQPRKAIIDMRNNGGGDSSILQPLIEALRGAIAQGFPVSSLYVIIGRETASSASLNTATLKGLGATLVGEATGGGASGFGEVNQFTLPNSRLVVSCSTRLFQIANAPGSKIDPDIAVDLNGTDYFADRDPVLEAILQQ